MSKPKKKITRNKEILLTYAITLPLCLAGYVFKLLLTAPEANDISRRNAILNGFNDVHKFLPVLSDNLSPSLILWCIIGLISIYWRCELLRTSKISPTIAITMFILYLIWYLVYLVIKDLFFGIVIANIAISVVVLLVALLFFNECVREGKNKKEGK